MWIQFPVRLVHLSSKESRQFISFSLRRNLSRSGLFLAMGFVFVRRNLVYRSGKYHFEGIWRPFVDLRPGPVFFSDEQRKRVNRIQWTMLGMFLKDARECIAVNYIFLGDFLPDLTRGVDRTTGLWLTTAYNSSRWCVLDRCWYLPRCMTSLPQEVFQLAAWEKCLFTDLWLKRRQRGWCTVRTLGKSNPIGGKKWQLPHHGGIDWWARFASTSY